MTPVRTKDSIEPPFLALSVMDSLKRATKLFAYLRYTTRLVSY